jgi:hypothetical protein
MDLERELTALAEHIAWPETPPFRLELRPRRRLGRAPRRALVLALAVLAVALAAALAVPQSRGAILRFLHLGGVTVQLVDRLPPVRERPLGASLGPVVRLDTARSLVPGLALPAAAARAPLHVSGPVVSLVFSYRGEPVLLSELSDESGGVVLKKLSGTGQGAAWVAVRGGSGLWLSGRPHVVLFPAAPPRLAGNVLVWVRGRTTYRLEGASLTRVDAIAFADELGS